MPASQEGKKLGLYIILTQCKKNFNFPLIYCFFPCALNRWYLYLYLPWQMGSAFLADDVIAPAAAAAAIPEVPSLWHPRPRCQHREWHCLSMAAAFWHYRWRTVASWPSVLCTSTSADTPTWPTCSQNDANLLFLVECSNIQPLSKVLEQFSKTCVCKWITSQKFRLVLYSFYILH